MKAKRYVIECIADDWSRLGVWAVARDWRTAVRYFREAETYMGARGWAACNYPEIEEIAHGSS